jgi:hypothetical protein
MRSLPAIADSMPARSGGLGQQRRKPHHPALAVRRGSRVQLLDVAVGQAEAQDQRTPSTIKSGGKRKPVKAEYGTRAGRNWRVLMLAASLGWHGRSECNSACDVLARRLTRRPDLSSFAPDTYLSQLEGMPRV